jgi:hypothetical protein
MSEYREIQGAAIQSLSSSTGTQEGQIWYDNSAGAFKLQTVTTTASWASGTSAPVATNQAAAAGTYLAGIMFGGNESSYSNQSLTYDGSSWTATPTLGTARGGIASANSGTSSATLAFQGSAGAPLYAMTNSEEWDGSSWTATPALNTATALAGGAGTSTAALCVGGELQAPSFGDSNRTEEWNGSSWTSVTNRPASIRNHSLFGLQTAAVSCLGINFTTASQEYDGTNWSTGGTNNTARRGLNDGTGSETTGIVAGGQAPGSPAGITATELYDGSSWTSSPASLPTGKFDCATFGNNSNAVSATGRTPTNLATVVEWSGIGLPTTKTLTVT